MRPRSSLWQHPQCTRRTASPETGTIGLLGLHMGDLFALRALAGSTEAPPRTVIYIFLSGGLAQQEAST